MAEQRLMKDGLDRAAVKRIAGALACIVPGFQKDPFTRQCMTGLDTLELKQRVGHIIGVMHRHLPADFSQTAALLAGIKAHWDPGAPGDNLAGFAAWPIIDYVGEYGLDHPEASLQTLKQLTALFSGEFAIRVFFIHHEALTLNTLSDWCNDPDEHVRRLVSEGSRPRLPWGKQLPEYIRDPSPVMPLLESLKDDPSEYVRRSVANNLNDISKDHPETVISCCRRWQKSATPEREWIIRHATRTLVKAGHPDVFGLLGYTENPKLSLQCLDISPGEIKLGESIEFSFKLQSTNSKPQTIIIDYAIHHMKANGQTAPKVFKFCSLEINPGETLERKKRHAIKPVTTRRYYPGEHAVEILINGKGCGKVSFSLRVN